MVLDVKGMKSDQASTDPADVYREEEKKPSRIPYALAMLLVGLGAYLKSMFATPAEAVATNPKPDEGPEPDLGDESITSTAPDVQDVFDRQGFWALSEEWQNLLQRSHITLTPEDVSKPFTLFTVSDSRSGPPVAVTSERPISLQPANDSRVMLPVVGGQDVTGPPAAGAPDPADPPNDPPDGEEPPTSDQDACGCTEDDDESTRNRAPQNDGPVQLFSIAACSILFISPSDLLAKTSDPDDDPLTVTEVSASEGSITSAEGGWTYHPGLSALAPVTLTYMISDGEFFIEQTAHFNVSGGEVLRGTDGDDLLIGSMCGDEIFGDDGDDNIVGRGGSDFIRGGAGDDNISGGTGNDTIFGGDGDDIISGGAGSDLLWGSAGNDRLYGGAGHDTLFGDAGDDFLDGGDGDDVLLGGAGNDVIHDGNGRDIVRGGTGDDYVAAAADRANDIYDGGAGDDILDYSVAQENLYIDLVVGTAKGVEVGEDSISGFEEVIGGGGDDYFVVGGAAVILTGNGGNNTFEFRALENDFETPSEVTHEIRDFRVGDTIRLEEFDLIKNAFDDLEDQFENLYGDFEDDDLMIRIRHDSLEGVRKSIVEADLNGDDHFETFVLVHGHHVFTVTEFAA